jgi:hypothetical protein
MSTKGEQLRAAQQRSNSARKRVAEAAATTQGEVAEKPVKVREPRKRPPSSLRGIRVANKRSK